MKPAVEVLHADVMNVQIVSSRDGAHTIKNIFGGGRPRDRPNDYVGVGEDFMHGPRNLVSYLARTLERDIACKADGNVGEITIPGAADAHAINFK